jgi:uncharacterized protein YjbI with pentapeptide repeats
MIAKIRISGMNLLKLWDVCGPDEAPAEIDERPLSDHIGASFIADLALGCRTDGALRERPMRWLTRHLTAALVFWATPAVLIAFWWRSMPAHDELVTVVACGVPLLFAVFVALKSWRHMRRRSRQRAAGPTVYHGLRMAAFAVFALAVAGMGWFRTEGTLDHYRSAWLGWDEDRLAQARFSGTPFPELLAVAQLDRISFVRLPEGWRGYDLARRDFFEDWCRKRDVVLTTCDESDEMVAEWQEHFESLFGADSTLLRRGADLRNASLFGAVLHGGEFRAPRLDGADLEFARMQGATLRGAQIQGARLWGAQMQGAVLVGAQMQGAVLGRAQMQRANLWGAQMQGANLGDAQMQGAVLRSAQMQGANLRFAQMQGANLRFAQMQGANLIGSRRCSGRTSGTRRCGGRTSGARRCGGRTSGRAQMQGAVLRRAQMQDVYLAGTAFDSATDLSPATMRGAGLRSVDCTSLRIKPALLQDSFGDASVKLPFDPPPEGWETEEELNDLDLPQTLGRIPNLPYDDVPDGADEDDNVEIHRWGTRGSSTSRRRSISS